MEIPPGASEIIYPEKPNPPRWRFLWGAEHDPSQEEWLIDGIIPNIGAGLLVGQWGMAKSYMGLTASMAVILGSLFAGQQVKSNGAVLYIAPEGQDTLWSRWAALEFGVAAPWLAKEGRVPEKLPLLRPQRCSEMLNLAQPNALQQLLELNAAAMAEITQANIGNPKLRLTVIDTLAAAGTFKDLSDGSEVARFMNALRSYGERTKSFALAITHYGKDTSRGTKGSIDFENFADTIYAIHGDRADSGTLSNTELVIRKIRNGPAGLKFPFTLAPIEFSINGHDHMIRNQVVTWLPASASRPRNWKMDQVFEQALAEALDTYGEITTPKSGMVAVKVVSDHYVRNLFTSAYPPTADPTRRELTVSRAFQRACKEARRRGLIGTQAIDKHHVLMWRAEADVTRREPDAPDLHAAPE
jgi:AAA domain